MSDSDLEVTGEDRHEEENLEEEPHVDPVPERDANAVYEESQAGVFDKAALEEYENTNKVPQAIAKNENFVEFNTTYVKKMNEGDGASYWISNKYRVLMIGEPNRESGEMYKTMGDTDEGTITMIERGSTFSAGRVEVTGSTNHDVFRVLFSGLSNKKVKFVD